MQVNTEASLGPCLINACVFKPMLPVFNAGFCPNFGETTTMMSWTSCIKWVECLCNSLGWEQSEQNYDKHGCGCYSQYLVCEACWREANVRAVSLHPATRSRDLRVTLCHFPLMVTSCYWREKRANICTQWKSTGPPISRKITYFLLPIILGSVRVGVEKKMWS